MATAPRFLFSLLVVSSFFLNVIISSNYGQNLLTSCQFDSIYQLGDSIADTGNDLLQNPSTSCARLPYGETFFNRPTGRCSNGLLMIDFLAMSAKFPLLEAYLNKDGSFDRGVNFAVAGATALSMEDPATNSLSEQLEWMFTYFNRTCGLDKDCLEKNGRALFLVGEIGGNDYNYAFWRGGKTIEEVKAMVPKVVQAIKDAVKRVIGFGATRIIVPGNFPIGCFPAYLGQFRTNDTNAYDELHCLKYLNDFSIYHNDYLQQAIEQLTQEYPNVIIVYGNYYDSFLWLFTKANMLGFDPQSLQKPCCGTRGGTVCSNPDERVSWDGVHLTQRTYELMASWLIRDIYPKLQCKQFDSYTSSI